MSDGGDLDVIETRQCIFDNVHSIITLVEQCTDKRTLQAITACYHNRTDKQTLQTITTQLVTTIGLIKYHLEQMKEVLSPTQQHELVNKIIVPQ